MTGQIAHKGDKATHPGRGTPARRADTRLAQRLNRLQRCHERREEVIDAFFDLADAIITVRSLIRQAWITYRWADRPAKRP